jgi:hypothetical protein
LFVFLETTNDPLIGFAAMDFHLANTRSHFRVSLFTDSPLAGNLIYVILRCKNMTIVRPVFICISLVFRSVWLDYK